MDSLIYVKSLKCKSVVSNDCLDFYAVIGAAKRKKKKKKAVAQISLSAYIFLDLFMPLPCLRCFLLTANAVRIHLLLSASVCRAVGGILWIYFFFFFFSSSLLLKTMNVNFFCPPHATAQRMHNSIFCLALQWIL